MAKKVILYGFVSTVVSIESEKDLLNKLQFFQDDCIGQHIKEVLAEPCSKK